MAVRAAAYSHSEDWLVSADHDGVVKYWQPNFNNVKALQAHNEPIRDLAFSPNDAKFVTASDDASLKIFDFSGGTEESVLTGHGWEAKTVDWHPTKGLLVSGSKDHQVKLWDPRTGRCLTTLHGHKNTISKTLFEPNQGQLLATCARDSTARIFDLRMMRDICLLRGHDKDISTLTWHPTHSSLLSTGGSDGSIFHYLLDEPNHPPGHDGPLPPYDTADPMNSPAETIYPAHRVPYAHDFPVWSLSWHPLGHVLASGSNDRVTRFWTRPRPGETIYLNDKYHLGEAGAEAQGTWDRRGGRRAMKEDEEQEFEDEADGLVDQQMPTKMPTLPGLPGLNFGDSAFRGQAMLEDFPSSLLPGVGIGATVMPTPSEIKAMDPQTFAALMAEGKIVLPPPPPPGQSGIIPPPLSMGRGMIPPPPPNFDMSKMPPELLAQFQSGNFPPPPPPPSGMMGGLVIDAQGDMSGAAAIRRRAPLPSQQESLKEEQRRGKYRTVR
jgi:polyadenylation factor subunit 2